VLKDILSDIDDCWQALPNTLTPAFLSSPHTSSECTVGNPGGPPGPRVAPFSNDPAPPKHLR